MKFFDYAKAISIGARERGILHAVYSVLLSRFCHGFGPFFYSMFRFYQVPSQQWRNYIHSVEANRITGDINGKDRAILALDKVKFFLHCRKGNIPIISIIGVLGSTSEVGVRSILSPEQFKQLMSSAPKRVFFKTVTGAHGEGAFSASRIEGEFWLVEGEVYSVEGLYEKALAQLSEGCSYLIQSLIKPHEALLPIMPDGALGTVRIITYIDGDEPKALLPVLRIPANGNVTDNFSLGLVGNLVAPINLHSGELGVAKVSRRRDWPDIIDVITHPDTGQCIAGKILPFWNETVELVLDAQRKTKLLPTLGWDIAITDNGPLVVEANTLYAVELLEVAYGRGVRDELEPVIALLNRR